MDDAAIRALVGSRVRVIVCHADGAEPIQEGTLIAAEGMIYDGDFWPGFRGCSILMPRIQLDDGRCFYGYECWWEPCITQHR